MKCPIHDTEYLVKEIEAGKTVEICMACQVIEAKLLDRLVTEKLNIFMGKELIPPQDEFIQSII